MNRDAAKNSSISPISPVSHISPTHRSPRNPTTRPALTADLCHAVVGRRAAAVELLRAAAAEFAGRIAFACSFGAEDMVLIDIIATERLLIDIFSLDTGRLPSQTHALMCETERRYGIGIRLYFPERDAVERYVNTHGIDAFYDSAALRRECCRIRKLEPLQRALSGRRAWITGMRAAQSATRAALPLRQYDEINALEKFNPLADWSETEVWAAIRLAEAPYNALHDEFYPSIGCAPCTRATAVGEDVRAGRWWWEEEGARECGLHARRP